jgi:uncharacterized membrane protein
MEQGEKADRLLGAATYSFGWLSAIYFINAPRHSIRWHARQSVVVFGALMVSIIAADAIFPVDSGNALTYMLHVVSMSGLIFISVALWILLPLQTFRGKPFLVPIFAPLTTKFAGTPPWTLPYEPWDPTAPIAHGSSPSPNAAWSSSSGGQSVPCGACGGSGRTPCSSCMGRGSWYEQPTTASGTAQLRTCGACGSSGRVTCMSCGGSGRSQALI